LALVYLLDCGYEDRVVVYASAERDECLEVFVEVCAAIARACLEMERSDTLIP